MQFDLIIIGGGPGGYVAAIRAASIGKKVALIEAADLGGTCLNRGCIPSKTMLKYAELIDGVKKASHWGIEINEMNLSLDKMIERKNSIVTQLKNGVQYLMDKNKIMIFKGTGTLSDDKSVEIEMEAGTQKIAAHQIIIATGSRPVVPKIKGIDQIQYHTTDTIFDMQEIPKSIAVIGGGVIGVEMASVFASLGSAVSIIELNDRIISAEDIDASIILEKALRKKGIKIFKNTEVTAFEDFNHTKKISCMENGEEKTIEVDAVLLAIGRQPNLSVLGSSSIKLKKNHIEVDKYLETSKKGIFAIGDVIGGLQLAHVASAEGLTAVANLEGKKKEMDYSVIPRCIYTQPQIASVGYTEETLKNKGLKYRVEKSEFSSNGKAITMGAAEGFAKLYVDPIYGEILGAVMAGENVTEMISQISSYMTLEGTIDELAEMIQPHPSLSETLMETANSLLGRGIHY
ncbi:dihydrolipoyl dehydrogenase [Lysinibacillus fusiformis]|nr:dihydrolipoyl dehydrogenase [Lysinibacillus fusiformis]